MKEKVLLAYASKYGSTQEVAATVAESLRMDGVEVDIQPMRQVGTLAPYSGIVLGAPLYIGRWHKDARRFLTNHQEAIIRRLDAGLRLALFTLGPTSDDEAEWQEVRAQLDEELSRFPWLRPVSVKLFGGRYDPRKLRFPDTVLASLPASPLHGLPARDVRDWEAVRDWAHSLAPQFQLAVSP